ncbi:MAG: HEAT repeat domain-containing protein, partial [Candidatus Muiribacteriaceae bacterium]
RALHILNKDVNTEISGTDISDHEFIDIMYGSSPSAKIHTLKRVISLTKKKYLNNIKDMLKEEKDPFVLATLIKSIGYLGSQENLRDIIEFIKHNDPRVRSNTIESLAMLGKNRGAEQLILPLVKDSNPRVRITAANYIMTYTDDNHVDSLIQDMSSSSNVSDRVSVLFLIENIPSPKYFSTVKKLSDDKNRMVSEKAESLLTKLTNIEEPEVNELALLEKMEAIKEQDTDHTGINSKPVHHSFHHLIDTLLNTKKNDTLKKTILSLERLGDTRAIPYLEKLETDSKVIRYFRERALQRLKEYRNKVMICPNCGYQMRKEDED